MYEIFEKLLKNKGVTASQVCKDTGIAPATLSDWKHGKSVPKMDKLKKIADYFEVTVDYLANGDISAMMSPMSYYLNDATVEIAQEMFDRPELKTLFDASRKLSPDDIRTIQTMVDALWRKERGDD